MQNISFQFPPFIEQLDQDWNLYFGDWRTPEEPRRQLGDPGIAELSARLFRSSVLCSALQAIQIAMDRVSPFRLQTGAMTAGIGTRWGAAITSLEGERKNASHGGTENTEKGKSFCRLNIDPSSPCLFSVISMSPCELFFLLFPCGEQLPSFLFFISVPRCEQF